MKKFLILLVASAVFILFATQSRANTEPKDDGKTDGLNIVVTSLEIGDKALNMTYEIRNESEDDVWIYTGGYSHGFSTFGMGAGADVSEEGHTLTVGLSLIDTDNTEKILGPVGSIRFVYLGPWKSQKESIFTEIPVHPSPRSDDINRKGQATHLAIELSYYPGDLSEYFFRVLEYNEKIRTIDTRGGILPHFYSWTNEPLNSREDELLIRDDLEFEKIVEFQVLRTVVDNVRIPYEEISNHHFEYKQPNLTSCTKVEIKYEPSMLDYFFPFASQKNLLSPEELKYLQSEKSLVLKNAKEIGLLANDINKVETSFTRSVANVVRYRCSVDLVCHYNDRPPMSFFVYNDNAIRVNGDVLPSPEGFPSLKKLTSRIEDLDLRMRCASNLKNQWYRFRFYNYTEALFQGDLSIRNQRLYPNPLQWCDDIRRPYPYRPGPAKTARSWDDKPYVCPSAGEGKCHYAMNPNCEPNSPGDMVLLFETKAGWNQCGGPELFTFDNHDPKGGCVLLNDGTVKFIRTEQELHALRWK